MLCYCQPLPSSDANLKGLRIHWMWTIKISNQINLSSFLSSYYQVFVIVTKTVEYTRTAAPSRIIEAAGVTEDSHMTVYLLRKPSNPKPKPSTTSFIKLMFSPVLIIAGRRIRLLEQSLWQSTEKLLKLVNPKLSYTCLIIPEEITIKVFAHIFHSLSR